MGLVVTGISQDENISQIENALRRAGLSLEPLQTIGPDDPDIDLVERPSTLRMDTGLITGDRGTGVPGLTGGSANRDPLQQRAAYFPTEGLRDRLEELEIPDSESDNYVEALQAGRSIVSYFAGKPENVGKLEEIFRTCGLAKVKTF